MRNGVTGKAYPRQSLILGSHTIVTRDPRSLSVTALRLRPAQAVGIQCGPLTHDCNATK